MRHLVFLFFVFITALLVVVPRQVQAEVGGCRFDNEACSCKYGEPSAGKCWDLISGSANGGTCKSRPCQQGWTCTCGDRTHECPLREVSRLTIDSVLSGDTALCHEEPGQVASDGDTHVELGGWTMNFSVAGVTNGDCDIMSWWINGEEIGDYTTSITAANDPVLEAELRSVHALFPLRAGDLLAFRFKESSYFCHLSQFTLNVDGSIIDVDNQGSSDVIRFARQYTAGWHLPSFIPTNGANEATAQPWMFVPLRTNFFSDGSPILPGVDYWQAPDGSRDHEATNFYYRIQL